MYKAKVLIVEDSFIVAHHLKATLEHQGYNVIGIFDSGEEAVKLPEDQFPDVVLMDIMLNGDMDGIETATKLCAIKDVPIIYITALSDKNTINKAKITEPYGYLTKPFEDFEIFTVLEMALYKHEILRKLKLSQEQYFSTVNSISDVVICVNQDFEIVYCNPSALKMTGYTREEMIGQKIDSVITFRDELGTRVNPFMCLYGSGKISAIPDGTILESKSRVEIPIGESSLSPMVDSRGIQTGLIIIFKDLRDKIAHEQLQQHIELQKLKSRIEGQEQERARISMELHDGLGQMLNAIKMNLKLVIQDQSDAQQMANLLNEAINESVRISENLLPSRLKNFSLDECLKSLCNQVKASSNLNIDYIGPEGEPMVSLQKKIHLYRISQEALNNVLKHSQAKNITLQITEDEEYLKLSIEDDGKGMAILKSENMYGHKGLVNMRDRADILGGKLTIESDPAYGTLVILDVPIKNLITD